MAHNVTDEELRNRLRECMGLVLAGRDEEVAFHTILIQPEDDFRDPKDVTRFWMQSTIILLYWNTLTMRAMAEIARTDAQQLMPYFTQITEAAAPPADTQGGT